MKWGLGYEYYKEENNSEYYFEGEESKKIPITIEIYKLENYIGYTIELKINNTYQTIDITEIK
ncbi:hypothetical protein DMC14_001380 [Metamycoplasma phocicerebrale]|uniref:Uncharacterized protein n=1 Tax=Metamycoplasma phocicerebrale TaxID=142649 RepID=A0A3T0TTQ9_9BACT|nr:hypothetical protein [Metamycoplasma phocicerebrale]AZZ65438.1 hypothetical protein DMC14_001380 [Metamycoplasma phocicerebrale]